MSLTDRISHFFNGYDDETEYDNYDNGSSQVRTESEGPQGNQKNRIMSIVGKGDHSQKKIMLFEPRVFSDAKQIASRLLHGQAAIINFERMDNQQSRRIVDFLSGVTYAIDGDIKRIGEQIFLCTPSEFSVEGMLNEAVKLQDF